MTLTETGEIFLVLDEEGNTLAISPDFAREIQHGGTVLKGFIGSHKDCGGSLTVTNSLGNGDNFIACDYCLFQKRIPATTTYNDLLEISRKLKPRPSA